MRSSPSIASTDGTQGLRDATADRDVVLADVNDDGNISISDALYLILWLFLDDYDTPPPAPYPAAQDALNQIAGFLQ